MRRLQRTRRPNPIVATRRPIRSVMEKRSISRRRRASGWDDFYDREIAPSAGSEKVYALLNDLALDSGALSRNLMQFATNVRDGVYDQDEMPGFLRRLTEAKEALAECEALVLGR